MSVKSNPVKDSKRRTTTMNDVGDTYNGSTLELIAYQSDNRYDYENVNQGYSEGIQLQAPLSRFVNSHKD